MLCISPSPMSKRSSTSFVVPSIGALLAVDNE